MRIIYRRPVRQHVDRAVIVEFGYTVSPPMRYDGNSPHTGTLPGPAATEPAGRPFTVSLIGGPADGRAIDVNQPGEWFEVAGARYVLRAAYKSGATEPDGHVGIFLPLYAHLWASHHPPSRFRRQQ